MRTTRQSAMFLLRCLTIASLLLSIVPPSTYTQAAPIQAPVPFQVRTPEPAPTVTSTDPATSTMLDSPLATPAPQTTAVPLSSFEPTPAASTTEVQPLLAVSAEPDGVAPGEVVTFSLALFNQTTEPMSRVVLSATLPATGGLQWIPGQAGWAYDASSKRLTADVGQLATSQGVTLTLKLRAIGPVDNGTMLEVEARSGDMVLAQGSASVWVAHPTRATITPQGGKLQSADGRVKVEFPAGALGQTAEITYRPKQIKPLALSRKRDTAIQFNLDALSESAQRVSQFAQPLTLTVSLKGLVDLKQLPDGMRPYLAYSTADRPGEWIEVTPIQVDYEQGTLSARLNHFSGYQAGVTDGTPGVWAFAYNPPQANLFSGAATYQIPIAVPAGRNGLQPQLALSYSSRRMDGRSGDNLADMDVGPIADGWSVDVMDISRERWWGCYWSNGSGKCFADTFVLMLNGTGYDLYPSPGPINGRYYAKDAPWLYIERRNGCLEKTGGGYCKTPNPSGGDAPNTTGDYWIVRMPDGTEARLGYYGYSEQVTNNVCDPDDMKNCHPANNNGYAGHVHGVAARRWRVDTITDTFGNTMNFGYVEFNDNGNESRSTLSTITYNSGLSEVNFNVINGNTLNPRIDQIDVKTTNSSGTKVIVRKYVIGRGQVSYNVPGPDWGCDDHRHSESQTILSSVQELNGAGVGLPAQSFGYSVFAEGDPQCHPMPHMVYVDNGYGGTTKIVYEWDGDTQAKRNYRVQKLVNFGGLNSSSALVSTYAYGPACYDRWLNSTTVSPCASRSTAMNGEDYSGPLVGHSIVTQTQVGPAGETLAQSIHRFFIDANWRVGREYQVQQFDPSGTLLQQQDTTWVNGSLAYAAEVVTTDYSSGTAATKRTSSTYDSYGNMTAQYDYGAEEPMVNGGFEDGQNGWNFHWTPTPASISQDTAFAGTSSLKLAGSTRGGANRDIGGLTPGATYTVRAWVKGVNATGQFQLWLHDTTGGNTVTSPLQTPGSSWTEVRLNYTANSTGKIRIHLQYEVNTGSAGAIYVDEVALAKAQDVGDERSTYSFYRNLTDNGRWLIGLKHGVNVFQGIVVNAADYSTLKTQTKWYFDDYRYDLTKWNDTAQITKGAVTMMAQGLWPPPSEPQQPYTPYSFTQYRYDAWGNPTVVTNALGYTTTTTYDGVYHIYPVQVTNAKGQTTQTSYDLTLGVPLTVTDANGAVTQYSYDTFGRLKKIARPGDSLAYPTEEYRYYDGGDMALTDRWPLMITHLVRGTAGLDWCSGGLATWDRTYYDGLGRQVEHQGPGPSWNCTSGGQEVNEYTTYNAQGQVAAQSVPYYTPQYVYATTSDGKVVTSYKGPVLLADFESGVDSRGSLAAQGGMTFGGPAYAWESPYTPAGDDVNYWDVYSNGDGQDNYVDYRLNFASQDWRGFDTLRVKFYTWCDGGCNGNRKIRVYIHDADGTGNSDGNGYHYLGDWTDGTVNLNFAGATNRDQINQVLVRVYESFFGSVSVAGARQRTHLFSLELDHSATIGAAKTQTTYDALGRVTQVTAPDGTTSQYTYGIDIDNGVTYTHKDIADANRHRTQYRYDAYGRTVKVLELAGDCSPNWSKYPCTGPYQTPYSVYATTQYTYNVLDNLTDVWDAASNHTQMWYDPLGRKTSMTDPDMGAWSYTYDLEGNLKTQTDAKSQTLWFGYDPLNRLTEKRQGGSGGTVLASYAYDGASSTVYASGGDRIIHASDGRPYVSLGGGTDANFTLNVPTSGQHALSVILHEDSPVSNPSGANSNVQVFLDGASLGTVNVPGGVGPAYQEYPTSWMLGPASASTFQVNLSNGPHTLTLRRTSGVTGWAEIAQDGSEIVLDYNQGRRTSMSDLSGSASWTYDSRGRTTTESKTINGAGTFNTSYAYDAMDRVTSMTYPGGNAGQTGEVVTQTYNAASQLAQVRSTTNGVNYASGMSYNANGSLARITYGNGVSTAYGYLGLSGNPWDVRPGRGLASYGLLWRIRTEAPSGQPLQDLRYAYDNAGNVTAIHDVPRAINGTLNYTLTDTFDTRNTTTWAYNASQTVPYNDGGNNVVKNTGDGSTWNATFYRNQFAVTTGKGIQVRFKVDNAQAKFVLGLVNDEATYRRLGIYAHDGRLNAQYNDGAGWREPTTLVPALQANVWYTLTMVVDDTRGMTLQVYPQSDPTRRLTYNIFLISGKSWRFQAWTWTNAAQGSLYLDDYREFSSGAIVSPDELMNFQYDALDRLLQANKATNEGYTESYSYNAIGNILSKSGLGSYTYPNPGQPRPHAATAAGSNAYTYDANGNMTTRTEGGVTYNQTWDTENRLSTVTVNGQTTTFVYDGDGKRVKKISPSGTVGYVGNYYEYNVTTSVATSYYYAGSTRVAMRQGGAVYYLHADHLGSASLTTDTGGNRVGELRYKPYGETRYTWGATPTDRRFTGQRSEEASLGSLYDYGARFYSPYLNRWIQPDTIVPQPGNPQTLNRYSYANNNPVKYLDPSGHDGIPFWVPFMAWAADSLQSIGDPALSPSMEGIRQSVGKGVEAVGMAGTVVAYTVQAAVEGRGDDTLRGAGGLAQMGGAVAAKSPEMAGQFVVGAVTAPFQDAWDFGTAAREYAAGERSGWDLTYQTLRLTADVLMLGALHGGYTRAQAAARQARLENLADNIVDWVGQGDDVVGMQNSHGDLVIRSADNTRKFRADFKYTKPHENPHIHLQWVNENGKWVGKRIWPSGVEPR